MGNTANVRVGSPKVGGYAFSAPMATIPLPTDATTALPAAYEDLGYLSEDGVQINPQVESEDRLDWGGDVVRTLLTERGAEVVVTLIECGAVTLAEVFGEDNVTVTGTAPDESYHIKFTGDLLPHKQYSFELKDGTRVGRVLVNDGQIITPGGGERQYTRTELKQFQVTIKCFRDAGGDFYHEYDEPEVVIP